MRARTVVRSLFGSAIFALAVLASDSTQLPVPARSAQQDTQVFDEAWRIVRDKFYDRNLKGLDWEAEATGTAPTTRMPSRKRKRSAAINAMLAESRLAHPPLHARRDGLRQRACRHLLLTSCAGRSRIFLRRKGRLFRHRHVHQKRDRRQDLHQCGVPRIAGGQGRAPARRRAVPPTECRSKPVGSFRNKAGKTVALKVRRVANGPLIDASVEPNKIQPAVDIRDALKNSARIIEANGRRIGDVRIWSDADNDYQRALEDVLSDGKLKDADALVWDLRGGWGGAQPHYLNVFNPYGPTMTLTGRDGEAHVVNYRWRKPVAPLIDNGTRSGKEVLAYGFKKNGYGPVIGERSAGALLAATAFFLSDGSLLILAVEDASVEGERLEGKGVEPTIPVPFDIRYTAGKDPQLDKAIEVLAGGA